MMLSAMVSMSMAMETCDQPLGLQSGVISDDQMTVSSQFTAAVGAGMARLGHDTGGGAWCPAGLVSIDSDTQEWIQIDLGKVVMVTGLSVQGRWGSGMGQEWTPELAIAWYDMESDTYVQTSEVYPANTDTYSIVKIQLSQSVETNMIRVMPRSHHPRAVCLRLELHGCDIDPTTEPTSVPKDHIMEIKADYADHQIVDDDRKEISGETLTLTDSKLFPIMLSVLATVTTILIILSVVLLRKISQSRKQIQLPVSNDAQYFQNTLHNNYNQQPQQLSHKKNIYETPKVEPIYSTPIEIFYPSSPSNVSTDSSECETLQVGKSATTSTPRQHQLSSFESYKSSKTPKFEDLVTFSPIYSYFSSNVEPKYSNIV